MSLTALTRELRANFFHLYFDVLWYGLLTGSTMSFLAVFVARQGATGYEVSLLSAGPAVVNLLFSLQAARRLEGRPLVRSTFLASLLTRLGYVILIPVPGLLVARGEIWAAILITLGMSIPGTVLAIAFNALLADVVPPEWRGQVVGRRNAVLALSTIVSSLGCGAMLDHIDFPWNYQIVFGVGAVGALMSSFHLSRLRLPAEPPVRVGRLLLDFARPGLMRFADGIRSAVGMRFLTRAPGKPLLRMDVLRGPFGIFMAVYFYFYASQYVGVPLYPIYNVRELTLTDGEISLGTALYYTSALLASLRLDRISGRLGHRGTLVTGALLFGLYPLFLYLAHSVHLFLIGSFVSGLTWAVMNGGTVNRLMERVPADDRPVHMAFHNLALNMGILSGSLAAPMLIDEVGLRPAMLMVAGLRLLAGVMLALWG